MAAPATLSTAQTLDHLNAARKTCLADATHYPHVITHITGVGLVGPGAVVELRRFGTDLIAEALSCPTLNPELKEALSLQLLPTLKSYLDVPKEDSTVIRNVIQATTSIYPLVFKHIISQPQASTWDQLIAIKSNILSRESSPKAPVAIRVACVKFIQRIIQTYTPAQRIETVHPESAEASLDLIPKAHPFLTPTTLEAEGSGLLDRMLSIFQEPDSASAALLLTATINSLGVLVTSRPSIGGRILNSVFKYNPFQNVGPHSSPQARIVVRSLERTLRALMIHLTKKQPDHPLAPRMQAYVEHLAQTRNARLQQAGQKRGAPQEPIDGQDNAKRSRVEPLLPVEEDRPMGWSSLSGGRCTVADLYSLTNNDRIRAFDAQQIQPPQLIPNLIFKLVDLLSTDQVAKGVAQVRARWEEAKQATAAMATSAPQSQPVAPSAALLDEEEEEYAPDDSGPVAPVQALAQVVPKILRPAALGPYIVPQPMALTKSEVAEFGSDLVARMLSLVNGLQEPSNKAPKAGFNRVAASTYDRDSWITVVSRLATRSLSGLASHADAIKTEGAAAVESGKIVTLGQALRESMLQYILEDWRKRLDVAVTWLNEEWYNDQVKLAGEDFLVPCYDTWVLRVFDGILPFLDAKDKILIRFLSEIPRVSQEVLERVKRLALDPERVSLAVNAIHYLALFRPPVRKMCIDALEDLYTNYEDARSSATKPLQKWRPGILENAEPKEERKATPMPPPTPPHISPPLPPPPTTTATPLTA